MTISDSAVPVLSITVTTATPASPPVAYIGAAAADRALGVEVAGDSSFRFRVDTNGRHDWGPGNVGTDTNLYRASASVLATDDSWRPVTMASLATQTQANFAAERVIGTYTIPGGDAASGSGYTFWGAGVASDTLTPTLRVRVRVGGLTGAVLGDSTTITCRTATGMAFSWSGKLAFTTIGNPSVVDADCNISEAFASGTGAIHGNPVSGTSGPDTSASITVVVTATWGAASSSNSIQTTSGSMERVNH